MIALKLFAIAVLVFLNGFFVAAEFALVKVRSSQLDALVEEGNRGAKTAQHIVGNLDSYLSACQLGITLASLALGSLGEPYLAAMISPIFAKLGVTSETFIRSVSFILAFTVITSIHITLGEQVPKILAIRKPLPATVWVAAPLRWFGTLLRPAIWFLNGVSNWMLRRLFGLEPASEHELAHSEEELRMIFTESANAKEVSPLGKELLINALDLRERVVRDIHTPRGSVIFLNTEDSFDENMKHAEESRHTRFPLCRGHLDDTLGLVHIKDLLKLLREGGSPNVESIRRELHTVPEMMPLEKLLNFFLKNHTHIALVVDEYGALQGLITLEDILEEIVGDITDEFDVIHRDTGIKQEEDGAYLVPGQMTIRDLNRAMEWALPDNEANTLAGLVIHEAQMIPSEGQTFMFHGFRIDVMARRENRITKLRLRQVVPKSR